MSIRNEYQREMITSEETIKRIRNLLRRKNNRINKSNNAKAEEC